MERSCSVNGLAAPAAVVKVEVVDVDGAGAKVEVLDMEVLEDFGELEHADRPRRATAMGTAAAASFFNVTSLLVACRRFTY